jgi:2-polyprenyl-6-hydroxyphenyl methylase/3-demethylubiquinone-9 3-methyltransferase
MIKVRRPQAARIDDALGLPASAGATVPCKVCGGVATLWGAVDFSKSCLEHRGVVLPRIGAPVHYHRCVSCGFLFTVAMDAWSHADFARRIYDAEYVTVDPDYVELRPRVNAELLERTFGADRASVRVLDYGGGNGGLARHLRARGFAHAESYDPFEASFAARPSGQFDLVVSFEVVEHVPQPAETFADMLRFLSPNGILFFTTLLQPADIERCRLDWWYVAPRNGHISLHTRASLAHLFAGAGFTVASANDNLHIAFKTVPAFAKHLLQPA